MSGKEPGQIIIEIVIHKCFKQPRSLSHLRFLQQSRTALTRSGRRFIGTLLWVNNSVEDNLQLVSTFTGRADCIGSGVSIKVELGKCCRDGSWNTWWDLRLDSLMFKRKIQNDIDDA